MAESTGSATAPKATLGLTGLTSNAMALIAPGAFLWLTFQPQVLTGAPGAGVAMWFGIMAALALCLATAVAYAELSKLYPGAGSSYFFAEQAFLSKNAAYKWARVVKFVVGWASHLYYWVYPGVMVGVTAILVGYLLAGTLSNWSLAHARQEGVFTALVQFGFRLGLESYANQLKADLRAGAEHARALAENHRRLLAVGAHARRSVHQGSRRTSGDGASVGRPRQTSPHLGPSELRRIIGRVPRCVRV